MATPTQETPTPARKRPRFRTIEARRVERLTPRMIRVTFTGSELDGFEQPGATQHLKLILPLPGQAKAALPDVGGASPGNPDEPRPLLRTYTPRRYDARLLELDIDFVLHGDGPASNWAAAAEPGDTVAIAGPGGRRYAPDPEAAWYVLAGDESALPAMGTLLEALPATARADVYAEVCDAADELDLPTPAQARVSWLHRAPGQHEPGRLLQAALREAPLPAGPGRLWLACEATAMRAIRKHFVEDRGLDAGSLVTRGYWKRGEINYPDHDYGED